MTSEAGSDPLLTYRQVGRLLGVGERAALNWVREHNLRITGGRPARVLRSDVIILAAALGRPLVGTSEAFGSISEDFGSVASSASEVAGSDEPIEAAYRVAGEAAAEVALVPLATMVEELRGLADQLADLARRNEGLALEVGTLRERQAGQETVLAAKDEAIVMQRAALATKDQALAADALALGQLRQRAEAAEAERDRLIAAQRPQEPPGRPETPEEAPLGLWARLGRWWRG